MNNDYRECDISLVSRFFDGELDPHEQVRIGRHVKDCQRCRGILRDHQLISDLFQADLKRTLQRTNLARIENRVLDQIRNKPAHRRTRLRDLFFSWKPLIPTAVIATIFFLIFSPMKHPTTVSGPSAVINSLTGNLRSVIIMETPGSRQTIIWFRERS